MMYQVDEQGNTRWVGPAEELGMLRTVVPALHQKIAEQREVIRAYEEQAEERRWPCER